MTGSVVQAIAEAVAAVAHAAKRDPVAQRIAAETRSHIRRNRHRPRWMRLVRQTTERLAVADRIDDVDGMIAAILELSALGIDLDQIKRSQEMAIQLSKD